MGGMTICGVAATVAVAVALPVWAQGNPATAAMPSGVSASARGAAATVDAFHHALHRGDTRSAAAMLAEDALIFEEGAAERTKTEYASHHLPADAAFSHGMTSTLTHRRGSSSGEVAWIASEGRTIGTYKGKPVDLLTTETAVLRRMGRGWKIVHIHWSSTKKP